MFVIATMTVSSRVRSYVNDERSCQRVLPPLLPADFSATLRVRTSIAHWTAKKSLGMRCGTRIRWALESV
jgi:hypothetical protein